MILSNHVELRRFFALSATPLDVDGLPVWPAKGVAGDRLRASGFSSTLIAETSGGQSFTGSPIGPLVGAVPALDYGFPFSLTCNAGAADGSPPAHDYDWFIACRVEAARPLVTGGLSAVAAVPCLYLTQPTHGYSGSVLVNLSSSEAAKVLPGVSGYGLVTPASLTVLLNHASVYCRRRSDGAIQWGHLGIDT